MPVLLLSESDSLIDRIDVLHVVVKSEAIIDFFIVSKEETLLSAFNKSI